MEAAEVVSFADRGAPKLTVAAVSRLRSIVEGHLHAFNARDFDAMAQQFDEDIEISVDGGVMHGREAARAYVNGVISAYPGVCADLQRVFSHSHTKRIL
jgi:hypothetical protein